MDDKKYFDNIQSTCNNFRADIKDLFNRTDHIPVLKERINNTIKQFEECKGEHKKN